MLKQLLTMLGMAATTGSLSLEMATNKGGGSYFYGYSKPNQRKRRREMRRTVFANCHIKIK